MRNLKRSVVNGKRECGVFDAAVVVSGYVSGHIRTQDYVLNKLLSYMPWLHISFRFHPGIADD